MGEVQGLVLREFGAHQPAPAADLGALHRRLLPTSPLLHLGRGFLEGFYYGVLPEDDLIFGTVAYQEGRPVAFVVGTRDANGFLTAAVKRRWRSLASVMVRHPPSPKGAWKAMRLVGSRGRDGEAGLGEILSLGILAPDEGGVESSAPRRALPGRLLHSVLVRIGDRPVIALVDESNAAARMMYGARGWTVAATVTAGWPTPQVVYRCESAARAAAPPGGEPPPA